MLLNNFFTKTLTLFFIASIYITNVNSAIFITPKQPVINANSYVLMDYNSGKVIAGNNENKIHSPASLAKLMTAYVVFQMIKDGRISLEDEVKISEKAWKTRGSKSFVEVGKTVKLETLLKGVIIQSGNDASVALAEHIAGTEGTFVAYMNEYALKLNMTNTKFENSSGLDYNNQYTTAADMAKLALATIKEFPEFYKWYSIKEFTYQNIKQPNRNKLLWRDKTIDGLKTGFTKKARYNLVVSANRLDMRLISVILGAPDANSRFLQAQKILDYGFRFFETIKIKDFNKEVPIIKAKKDTVKIGVLNSDYITIPRGQFKLSEQSIILNSDLTAPIKKGDEIGNLIIKFEGKILEKLPLVAIEDVEQAGLLSRLIYDIKKLF